MQITFEDIMQELKAIRKENAEMKQMLFANKEIMTHEQAAKYMGRGEKTLRTLRDEGKIPFSKDGGRYFYSKSDLDMYIKLMKTIN